MRIGTAGIGSTLSLIAALLVMLSPPVVPAAAGNSTLSAPEAASWTIMIYMAADVVDSLPWELDINEMEAAKPVAGTTVIALVDPPGASDTLLLKIEHDENLLNSEIVSSTVDDQGAVIQGEGDVNTGSPGTLRDFIVFSASEYPADNLVLILWGHGNGWRGVCPDDNDPLTLPELRSALAAAKETLGRGMDLVVLDVCAGATLELAYEIHDCADMLVGSELSVPSEGLPYMEILNALAEAPDQSMEDFGISVAELYVEWADYGSANPTAASLFDLRLAAELIEHLNSASDIGLRFEGLYHPSLTSAVHSSEHTEDPWLTDFGRLSGGLCTDELPLEMRAASLEMAVNYASAVRYHGECNIELREYGATTGLSLYAPSSNLTDEGYLDLRISTTAWPDLSLRLRNDSTALENGPGPSMNTQDSDDDGDDLPDSAILLWETDETWNYTSFEVHVYRLQQHGLVVCLAIHSEVPEVGITGITGSLMITASACIGDEVYSYHVLNTTLYKLVRLDLLVRDGAVAYEGAVDIVLLAQSSAALRTECSNGSCTVWVVVPEWAGVGEVITLQAIDAHSGDILSESMLRITDEDRAVTLYIHWPEEDSTATMTFIGLAVAAILLVASAMVYASRLKRR